jgi:hypothetical protein
MGEALFGAVACGEVRWSFSGAIPRGDRVGRTMVLFPEAWSLIVGVRLHIDGAWSLTDGARLLTAGGSGRVGGDFDDDPGAEEPFSSTFAGNP